MLASDQTRAPVPYAQLMIPLQAARCILGIARLATKGVAAHQVAETCLEWCTNGAAFLSSAGPKAQRGLRIAVEALPRQVCL
jgi:hypothetical protein